MLQPADRSPGRVPRRVETRRRGGVQESIDVVFVFYLRGAPEMTGSRGY